MRSIELAASGCLLCCLATLPACVTGRHTQPPDGAVSACSLVQEPQKYNQQTRAVTAYMLVSGDEDAALYLPGCGSPEIGILFSPDFAQRTDPALVARLRRMQRRTRATFVPREESRRGPNVLRIHQDRLAVVVVGRFEAVVPPRPPDADPWELLGTPFVHPSSSYKHRLHVATIQRMAKVSSHEPWE
jgi:hypothetical protein